MPAPAPQSANVVTASNLTVNVNVAALLADAALAYFDEHPELDSTTYTWSVQTVCDPATGMTVYQSRGVCEGRATLRWAIAIAPGPFGEGIVQ